MALEEAEEGELEEAEEGGESEENEANNLVLELSADLEEEEQLSQIGTESNLLFYLPLYLFQMCDLES